MFCYIEVHLCKRRVVFFFNEILSGIGTGIQKKLTLDY